MITFQTKKKLIGILFLKFTFVTLFPNLIEPYLKDSILNRAVESNLISYDFIILEILQQTSTKS